jgi:hypothetical protein
VILDDDSLAAHFKAVAWRRDACAGPSSTSSNCSSGGRRELVQLQGVERRRESSAMCDEYFNNSRKRGRDHAGGIAKGEQTHLCNHVAHRLDIDLGLRENLGRFVRQGLDGYGAVLMVVPSTRNYQLTLVVVVVPTFTYDPLGAALEALDERHRITPSALLILQNAGVSISPDSSLRILVLS